MKKIDENIFQDLNSGQEKTKIEDFLEEEEDILWQGKPNKKAYILSNIFKMLPIALIWIVFDGFFIFVMSQFFNEMGGFKYLILVFFLLHLAPVWIWIYNIIKAVAEHKNIEYAFTNKKIIIKKGVIGIDFVTINYADITGIKCKVSITDKLLKVGDIYINSTSHASILNDLSNPYEIANRLNKVIIDIKADINYPNAYRPLENEGYKTKYKG